MTLNPLTDHTFVICAYRESPFLEACIQSLKAQSVPSRIIMVTSTPNDLINALAQRYEIPLYVNEGEGGITQDWNFGYAKADTPLITIAHQDDVYLEDYTSRMIAAVERAHHPLIYFSDYGELREDTPVLQNRLLRVKRLMLAPLKVKRMQTSRWMRRRILSLGSPICCPAVTYVRDALPPVVFQKGFRSCEDWEAWEKLSKLPGAFVYDPEVLMYHRIHAGSETSAIIGDNARSGEEYQMFCKFWPKPIAKLLVRAYAGGQKSNTL
jgi:glycosyltransferase involved in cell wall biosynthesis